MAYNYASHTLHAWGIPATLGVTLHAEANAFAINIHTLPTSEGQWLVDANGLIGVEVGGSSDTSHFSLCPISYHRSRVSSNIMRSDSRFSTEFQITPDVARSNYIQNRLCQMESDSEKIISIIIR